MVFMATNGPAIDWLEPTARNSKRLPVKANGLVRLRSPASFGSGGSTSTPTVSVPLPLDDFGAARLDLLEDIGQLLAQEDRDDGRRGLVGAEAVIVAGMGHDGPQQARVLMHGPDHGGAEDEELHVGVRRVARIQEVALAGTAQRPVDVLAGTVHAGEGLLVRAGRPCRTSRPRGESVIMINCWWSVAMLAVSKTGRDFVLGRGHFVVAGLDRHAQLEQLALGLQHEGQHALGNRAEVVVFELLALGRLGAEERAAGRVQVGPREVEVAVDEEIFLLGTGGRGDQAPSVWPKSFRMRWACMFSACMERSKGVFLSSASPVQETKAVGMQSVVPLGFSRM